MYYELTRLSQLAASKPEKFAGFLPDNVAFDVTTATLTHTYRGGAQVLTSLSALNLQPISLVAEGIRRQPINGA
jgi:hypothetical protein